MSCKVGEILRGNSSDYSILKFIGEGGFGKVAKCQKVATKETVAVKILKNNPEVMKYAEKELTMLQLISEMDPDRINVVKFLEMFQHEGQPCLAFEMLPIDLFDLLNQNRPMCLNGIRPVAKQLMVALDALQGMGILHTDIKTDNIMLASLDLPVRVKLIDFGLACHTSDTRRGQNLQTLGYRAPEVFLGLPLTGAIDVWSVGCVLGDLFLAANFFPFTPYDIMKFMIGLLGQPEDHLLRAGKHTHKYFTKDSRRRKKGHHTWRLLTPEEYSRKNNISLQEPISDIEIPYSLDALLDLYPLEDGAAEFEDRLAFVDFLKHLLQFDWTKRITPSQALQHKFITMSHLSEYSDNQDYLKNARKMMGISPNPDQESFSGSHLDTYVTASSSIFSGTNSGSEDKDDGPTVESPDGLTAETLDTVETPATVETPDGSTVETPDGSTVETSDGPTVETPDSSTVETPDSSTVETPDSSTVETPDSSTVETPDSSTVETPDSSTVNTPDSSTVETPDSSTVNTPDGASGQYTLEELTEYLLKNYRKNPILDYTGVVSLTRPSTSFKTRLMKGIRNFCRGVKKAFCCCCQVEDD